MLLQLMTCRRACIAGLVLSGLWLCRPSTADEAVQLKVTLRDNRFDPAEIHVPSGKPAALTVTNEDSTAEEFESTVLRVEKVIAGGHYGVIRLRPLGPGRYSFVGEYHPETARGVVIAD